MALPLIVKDNVLGALSVQSNQANAFSDDDITALQSLANQVAIAINNARLLQDLASAHRELLRNKTFEAIATTTGQTIHWVGNKAAPIPSSSRRVREDLCNLLAVFHCLCQQHDQPLDKHPFWPFVSSVFETASQEGIDLDGLARRLAEVDPRRMQLLGGLDSILEDLAIIEQSATSIINIKEDLIGPMRLQKINDVDLTELLRRTIFEMGLPDGVVQTDFAEGMPHLQVDARQIGQVYNNLIKNAWEALQGCAGPRIVVSAHLTGDAAYIMTEVSDNGPGIAPEILEKIWISFFTTKGDRGGTGLGLSACIAIINQCDGKISVSSEVGKGTTFTVLLPVEGGSSSDNSA
ncbi:MAG: GAF domain-containing protein [Chloroflexota bacterium]|nr:MAG: GAF domain-containing protein [Chloroflexota bacterium]